MINQQGSGCSGAMLCIAPYNRSNALSQYVKHVTAIFFQNPLSKKTARTTAYHTVYGQLIYHYLLFSQVWVDKRNPTWYPSRVRVSTG